MKASNGMSCALLSNRNFSIANARDFFESDNKFLSDAAASRSLQWFDLSAYDAAMLAELYADIRTTACQLLYFLNVTLRTAELPYEVPAVCCIADGTRFYYRIAPFHGRGSR